MHPTGRFGTAIIGTGHHAPARVLTNENLEQMVDTSDEWITSRTGVRERRITVEGEHSGTLALEASRRALASAGLEATDLDLILVCTVTPEVVVPSTACLLQDRLGVAYKAIPAFDLGAACSGFLYGLTTAHAFHQMGQFDHILVVGVECLSRITNYRDRSTCVLFGDGAGAMVLRRTTDTRRGVLYSRLCADGSGAPMIHVPGTVGQYALTEPTPQERTHYLHMDGPRVFKLAVNRMHALAEEALAACNLTPDQIDLVVPHQANRRIIESLGEKLEIRPDQLYLNIDRFGNTSAASIPIAYDECVKEGRVKPGDIVLMMAFGAGLTWGCMVVRA